MRSIHTILLFCLLAGLAKGQGVTQLQRWHAFRGNPYFAPTIYASAEDTATYTAQAFGYLKLTPLPDAQQPVVARNVGAISLRWPSTALLPELVWVQIKRSGVTTMATYLAVDKQPDITLAPTALTINYVYQGPEVIPNITEKSIWLRFIDLIYQ